MKKLRNDARRERTGTAEKYAEKGPSV